MGLKQEINEILEEQKRAEETRIKTLEKIEKIQEKIEKGETTGNKLKDFAIVYYFNSEELETRLKNIKKDISENQEKPILVIDEIILEKVNLMI